MSRTFAKTTLALAVLTTTTLLTGVEATACGGGGGGYRGGYAPQRVYHRAPSVSYQTPVYRQPVYQQPAVQQPTFQQPAQAPRQFASQQGFPQQQGFAPQPQVGSQQPIAPQRAAAPQPSQRTQPAAPNQAASATQSALDALAALSGGPAPTTQQPAISGHVGQWTATLNGTNRVRLQLDANGAFSWTADSNGKVSRFAGSYQIANGQLTLIRSNDSQQLAGAWTADTRGGFRFKLAAAKDSGLLFVRG